MPGCQVRTQFQEVLSNLQGFLDMAQKEAADPQPMETMDELNESSLRQTGCATSSKRCRISLTLRRQIGRSHVLRGERKKNSARSGSDQHQRVWRTVTDSCRLLSLARTVLRRARDRRRPDPGAVVPAPICVWSRQVWYTSLNTSRRWTTHLAGPFVVTILAPHWRHSFAMQRRFRSFVQVFWFGVQGTRLPSLEGVVASRRRRLAPSS